MDIPVVVSHSDLERFSRNLLEGAGTPPPFAELTARSLVAASLRGVDSHGVQLLPFYLDQIAAGDMNPTAEGQVVSESGCCLIYDGGNGLGQVVSDRCCDHAIRLARANGAAVTIARESNHFGAAAFWGQKLSAAGLLGIVVCNASPIVPPWQGKEPRVGTNPICVSVPGDAWQLDMATTTVAAGKIFKAYINHQPEIPAGWALDREGVPTTDTEEAYKGYVMPLGGYKGSGLAFFVELLCGVLGGGAFSTDISSIRWRGRPVRVSQCFIAIDIARFMPVEEFRARLDTFVGMVKSAAPAQGYDEVLIAGEPERRYEAERRRSGVPVGGGTWKLMLDWAAKFGVAAPQPNPTVE